MPEPSPTHPLPTARYSPAYLWGLGSGVLVFVLYAVTLAPTTQFWDTSEYIATSHILGIPHPPGNPLFVLLGRTWDILLAPLGLSVAVRINLFSAFMGAAAHGLWFLVFQRITAFFTSERRLQLVGAAAAVLVSASAFTVWNQSNVNEKVYTVSLFTIALISWLIFFWRDHLEDGKDDNLLVLIVFILALSVGNHLMAFLAAPAVLAFILLVRPGALLNWRLYAWGVLALVTGLSVHLFLPLRAALDPIINEADPTCGSVIGALASIITWGQAGCTELSEALTRRQYDKPPLFPRLAPLHSQLLNYMQYFDWQWSRSLGGEDTVLYRGRLPFTFLFGFLGLIGASEHRQKDRATWAYVLVLFATLSAGLVLYLNFKYGYSIAAPVADRSLHEVRERDYFFIGSFSVWGLWAGLGIFAVWQRLADKLNGWLPASPVLVLALVPLVLNWTWADRSKDWSARDWAYNLLMSVEPYGVLFTNGDNDTFPLWYIQEVEGVRQDVTVIVTSYLNTDWYAKQLRDLTQPCAEPGEAAKTPTRIRCQRPYAPAVDEPQYRHFGVAAPERTEDSGTPSEPAVSLVDDSTRAVLLESQPSGAASTAPSGVAIPMARPLRAPTRSILQLDDAMIDTMAQTATRIPRTTTYSVGRIRPTVAAGTIFQPWHQFALAIIQTSMDERPVYFASSGSAPSSLGLEPYLMRQGLAYRLVNGDLNSEAPASVAALTDQYLAQVTGAWVDVPRTRTLLDEVFVHHSGIPEWEHWPDRSTIGIPNYYAWAYYAVAQAALERGDAEALEELRAVADRWAVLGGG